jgi:putative endonuclease
MPYFVYLIVSKIKNKKKISYVGYTGNLKKRLGLHNSGKGAKFTRGKKWKLVYYEKYDSKSSAMKNEYILKKNYKLRKKLKNKK